MSVQKSGLPIEGQSYAFEALESILQQNEGVTFIVANRRERTRAAMVVLGDGSAANWLLGDAMLFYQDGRTHSALSEDEFVLLKVIDLNEHPDKPMGPIDALIPALLYDLRYRETWVKNLSAAFQEASKSWIEKDSEAWLSIPHISQQAANDFINTIIGVK